MRPPVRSVPALAMTAVLAFPGPLTIQDPAPGNPLEQVTVEKYGSLLDVFVAFVGDQLKNLPAPDKSARENAFGCLSMFWVGAASGIVVMPAAGLALGTGIGAIVGAAAGGVGAVPGGAMGALIGTGSGMVVSFAGFIGAAIMTVGAVAYIEENFPATAARNGSIRSGGLHFADPPNQAGPMESYFVALVRSLPPQLLDLADRWDRLPGLSAAEQKALRGAAFVREPIQKLAWIKRNGRVSEKAPASAPVGNPFSGWIDLPSSAEMHQFWQDAFGLGAAKMTLTRAGKLELRTPGVLRAVGAPAEIELDVPDVDLKVGGNGGLLDPYVRFEFRPGPLQLDWGTVSVEKTGQRKDRIRLAWSAAKGSTMGTVKVTWKWNGPEQVAANIKPALAKQLSGHVWFKVDGMALVPDGFKVMDIDVDFKLPKELREATDALKDTVTKALGDMGKSLEKLFEEQMPWARVWRQVGAAPGKSLERHLQTAPGRLGMQQVDAVEELAMRDGTLRAKVRGQAIGRLQYALDEQAIAQRWQQHNNKFQGRPIAPIRPGRGGDR